MKPSSVWSRIAAAIMVMASAYLLGCEEDLELRPDAEIPFTMYGVLSPDLDTQSVRVYLPEEILTLGSPEPLEVDFTSTDLKSGERRVWNDTVLVNPNGQFEHVFWDVFRVEYGHEYRVEAVRRSDGATSYAEVRVPPPTTVVIINPDEPLLEIAIEGENIRALKPQVMYSVSVGQLLPLIRYFISYEGQEQRVDRGWQLTIKMKFDSEELRLLYAAHAVTLIDNRCPKLTLHDLELHFLVGDAAWDPPGGAFDPNVLSYPRNLDNVENGFGFIGGGYRVQAELFPSREAVEKACFAYDLGTE